MGSEAGGLVRRNRNRGYQQLRVWADAIELYRLTSVTFRKLPYELKRVASQNIASVDSVHRNIAEGYCRRSIKEYLQHLYVALGSLGESVSGFTACREAGQLTPLEFEQLDALAFRLENGLLRLVQSLETKRDEGDWIDTMVVRDGDGDYDISFENHKDEA
jgi:four helix bundle protein